VQLASHPIEQLAKFVELPTMPTNHLVEQLVLKLLFSIVDHPIPVHHLDKN